ncbi:MAG: 50S ribosomal protein L18Ae, partial [archaeon]|nr:50S ribosomal protein L18Ae [archaeon]
MADKTFIVTGTYRENKNTKKFAKEMIAVNEKFAKDKTYSQIGSKHRVTRHMITIE